MNSKEIREKILNDDVDSSLLRQRRLFIYKEVDEDSALEIVKKIMVLDARRKANIYIYINSPGGAMCYGNAIIEAMLRVKSGIVTVISGEACSMAGMISIHGDKRLIESSAYWMAHDIMGGVDGEDYLSKMRKRVEYISRLQEDMKNMFLKRTKLTKEEIHQALYGELWLGAEDCVKKGIADRIV